MNRDRSGVGNWRCRDCRDCRDRDRDWLGRRGLSGRNFHSGVDFIRGRMGGMGCRSRILRNHYGKVLLEEFGGNLVQRA
jgi:hypothetical protein